MSHLAFLVFSTPQDKEQLETQIMKGEGSPFKDCRDFTYAFKIRVSVFHLPGTCMCDRSVQVAS